MKKISRKKFLQDSPANNYEWFIKKADVSRYAGRWIAVENKKIVASNNNIKKLLEEISQNWPSAAIAKVPKRGQVMVL